MPPPRFLPVRGPLLPSKVHRTRGVGRRSQPQRSRLGRRYRQALFGRETVPLTTTFLRDGRATTINAPAYRERTAISSPRSLAMLLRPPRPVVRLGRERMLVPP